MKKKKLFLLRFLFFSVMLVHGIYSMDEAEKHAAQIGHEECIERTELACRLVMNAWEGIFSISPMIKERGQAAEYALLATTALTEVRRAISPTQALKKTREVEALVPVMSTLLSSAARRLAERKTGAEFFACARTHSYRSGSVRLFRPATILTHGDDLPGRPPELILAPVQTSPLAQRRMKNTLG